MHFTDWLASESRYKGLKRQFVSEFPDMPRYVANQLYWNRVGVDFRRKLNSPVVTTGSASPIGGSASPDAVTIAYTPSPSPSYRSPLASSYQIGEEEPLQNVKWYPKPVVIQVSPLDFDETTLRLFMMWKFGFDPKDHAVRNDTQRFAVQRQLLANRTQDDNEPVIVIRQGNKYKLVEGFHRTMMMLLSPDHDDIGAPPDQVELVRNNRHDQVNLSLWRRVPIKAYVGEMLSRKIS